MDVGWADTVSAMAADGNHVIPYEWGSVTFYFLYRVCEALFLIQIISSLQGYFPFHFAFAGRTLPLD